MSFQDIGAVRLKNIAEPVRVYRIVQEPLPELKKRSTVYPVGSAAYNIW